MESDASANFQWSHTDAALVGDKQRVAGRLLNMFSQFLDVARRPRNEDADEEKVTLLNS